MTNAWERQVAKPDPSAREAVLEGPRVGSHDDRLASTATLEAGEELVDEADDRPGSVRGAHAEPGAEHFAGVGPGGEQGADGSLGKAQRDGGP